jgi:carboxylesterase type B
MTDTQEDTLVGVRGGTLRGLRVDGLTRLRGVRYATAARFAPPVPEAPAWLSFVTRGADALADSGWVPYAGRRSAIHRFG